MKKILILCTLFFVNSVFAQQCIVRESDAKSGWQLLEGKGTPWMKNVSSGIKLSDDTLIQSSDSRYNAKVKTKGKVTTLLLTDRKKQLDQKLEIEALDNRCFTILLTVKNTGEEPISLKEIIPIEGTFSEKHDPEKPHVLMNGTSMSKPLPTVLTAEMKSLKCSETIALESPALAAGYLTGKHNLNRFTVTDPNSQPVFRAHGDCNGCLLMPGASRETDLLFISLHDNPLPQLERYAELAGKINNAKIWPPRVAWCTWYAGWMHAKMNTFRNGIEKGIEENIPYIQKYFVKRGGLHTMRICDDHQPHGDWPNKTGRITQGFDRLANVIDDAGIVPGVWYPTYWASCDSKVFKEHPDWFARKSDGSTWKRISKKEPKKRKKSKVTTSPEASGTPWTLKALYNMDALAIFDTSHPEVQQYFEDAARTWRKRGFRYVTNDFLGYIMSPSKFHDPTMTKVEVFRAGLEAVRRGLGDDVFYRTISGPIGPRMGIANDLRISGDSHGDNPAAYYRTAQVWFYHRRLWLNDPSAVVCSLYGEEKPIEWNKMWMSWIALSGTVMTYGEVLETLPKRYINMYQKLFPPLPRAGRPLDIWENDPYLLWGMNPGEKDSDYVLFGVFDVQGDGQRNVRLNLDEIDAQSRGWEKPAKVAQNYLLWDFWEQKLITSEDEKLELPLRAKSCYLFSLRPDLGRPQLLGTSGHFSQGVVETENIKWNADKKELRGKVQGNGGDPSTLFFHVPTGMQLKGATFNGKKIATTSPQSGVIAIKLPALDKMTPLSLNFTGKCVEPKMRAFVPGRTATRF